MANRVLVSMMDAEDEPVWLDEVEPFMQKVMALLGIDGQEISVSFCNDSQIRELNNRWRGVDAPTDVLSFEDGGEYTDDDGCVWQTAGDVVISCDTLARSLEEVGEDEQMERERLLVHGLLHLNGYDHGEEHLVSGVHPVCKMLVMQEKVLRDYWTAAGRQGAGRLYRGAE